MLNKLPDRTKAIVALITANIIWGAASPTFKLALENITPFTLAYLRFFAAALIFFPFVWKKSSIRKSDWKFLLVISVLGIFLHISTFFYGLTLAPAINAPIIIASGPIFLYISSIFILNEKPHVKILSGLLVCLIGIVLIVGQPVLSQRNDSELIGNILFFVSMLGAVGHAIASKEIIDKYKPAVLTFWSFLLASLTFYPFFLYETINYHPLATLNTQGLIGILFGIFLSSAAAFYLFEYGLERLSAQETGIFAYIDPIITSILAVGILGETITPLFLAGSLLVFLGIIIAEGKLGFHHHTYHRLRKR